ncbi:MAG: PAS domain S-box protein [Ignavibacteriaceae bacterium]|nr:PAS domain S-box protein [Ignavibacteriaceae bacterium]
MKTTFGGNGKLLRTILNNTPITIFAVDSKGVFTLSEGKGLEKVGLKPGENVGVSALDLYASLSVTLPNNEIITGSEMVRRVMAGETISAITELRGTYFDNQFVPYRDAKGKVVGMIGIATIITERMQAENALRESEKRFRALVEKSFEGILLIDSNGKLLYPVFSEKQLFGYRPEELVGTDLFNLAHPNFLDTAKKLFSKLLNSPQSSVTIELQIKNKDNSWRWIEAIGTNLLNEPSVNAIVVNYRDITKRMQAQKQLLFQSSMLDQVRNAAIATNLEGKIIYWNKFAERLYGWRAEEVLGKQANDLVVPPAGRAHTDELRNRIDQKGYWEGELEFQRKDGTIIPVYTTSSVLKDITGKDVGRIGISTDITERKKAESDLQFIRNAVETAADSWLVSNSDGYIIDCNTAACLLFGYTRSEFLALKVIALNPLATSERWKEYWAGMSEKKHDRIERLHYRKDGSVFLAELSTHLVVRDGGEYMCTFTRDITERKKSSDQFQKIITAIEQTADTVVITDQNGIIEYVNSAFLMITGYSREEVIGKTPRILKSSMHSESFYKDFWEKILAGNTYQAKFINRKRSGELYIIEKTITPVKSESGEITHFISTGRDVTEKERIEDELYKNTKILQSYIQYSIAPLVLLDKDFNFLQVNEAYANTCQRDVSEFMGHNHFEFYPSDAKADFEKVVNNKEAVRFVERPFVFPDHPEWGVTYWDWSLTPILDKMGEVEFLVYALRDVTQRKKGLDEIRKSQEQLRALYSHLQNAREEERTRIAREIHDSIGQSLTGLKMDLSLLETELAQQEDMRERNKLYGKIQTMYILLDEMIQSVRDVSAQLRPLILDSLGLVTAIEWQAEEFQKKTGLTCECILPKEKVELNRDGSTVLFRILQECLTNIIRHAKATKVSIKLERKGNHILLEVQDNGIGIDENVVKEINSLGLLGMKERALVLGGSVDILGNHGSGTIVTVKIPQGG